MKIRSRNNIKIQTSPILEHNTLNTQFITYNKPFFINMTKETNNMYKASTLSTKINTSNLESPFDGSNKKNKINNDISVKEFDLGKNYSKTAVNFFTNEINSSNSSNEDDNAVAQGHDVDSKKISDCDKPPGPSNISAKGILYFPVIPELKCPPIVPFPPRIVFNLP